MPSVLLSSCGSEAASYCNGATEAAVMNAILALVQDYLQVSDIQAALRPAKVPPAMVASIANRQRADLLFCMRSNAAPAQPGVEIYFHPSGEKSRRAAQLLQEHLSPAAPDPQRVKLVPAPQLPDFRMARCPAVQLRLGCRDNPTDAQWMLQNTGVIARALAKALTEWFGKPCHSPFAEVHALVHAPGGSLALRRAPDPAAELLCPLPNGSKLTLLGREGQWQQVEHEGRCGYVKRQYLQFPKEPAKEPVKK